MSNKPKEQTTKRKKQRKGKKALTIITAGILFIMLACGDSGCGRDGVKCTPELPPAPSDWKPEPRPTADYSQW